MTPGADVRTVLAEIGERRKRQGESVTQLARDTAAAVKRARAEKVSMVETARLVGLDRTALYKTYGAEGK